MRNPLSRYTLLVRRWAWMAVLGITICGGGAYLVSRLTPPVYQASATLILNLGSSPSAYDNFSASTAAVPTYARLLLNPAVLGPVAARHPAMTVAQLGAMIAVKPQTSTQLIELDVQNGDPLLAMQIANELCQSFVQFTSTQLPGSIQVLPALKPVDPIKPGPRRDAAAGALVGLGLALVLIVIFEWLADRLASSEEAQELLGAEVLTVIPHLSHSQYNRKPGEVDAIAEEGHILCDTLNAVQASQPFKLVMVTSALASEGKSTLAANLAFFLAQAGKRVLLVDANLRAPVLDQRFQLDNLHGLSSVFLDTLAQPEVERYLQTTSLANLRVLTSGGTPANSADLLQSPQANQLLEDLKRAPFDYVLFDAPPLLAVADAQILLSRIRTVILVVDPARTPRRALSRARRVLERVHATVLGVAINNSRWSDYGKGRQYAPHKQQPEAAPRPAVPLAPRIPVALPVISMPANPPVLSPELMGRSPHLLSYASKRRDGLEFNAGNFPWRSPLQPD